MVSSVAFDASGATSQGKRILNSRPVTPAAAGVQKIPAGYQLTYGAAPLDSGFSQNVRLAKSKTTLTELN